MLVCVMADGASMQIISKAILSLFALTAVPAQAGEFRVVAISADPDAVVLADAAGRLQRHAAGEALAAPDWRVVGVSGGKVVFEQALAVLRVQAGVGDRLDFDALAARARAPSSAAPGKPANGR
ncbi:hypothetical protein [Tahibacter harae]|uniref:Uncharacterized protein n=1 Tax=Tahibacter harae TaxID=2963937 RepID=A0ABT1QML1_9GAMM|nr:hypothetical protein [Tahibacter harae]MCQ4163759.1 hypothetical protein [Tahibacter harae]